MALPNCFTVRFRPFSFLSRGPPKTGVVVAWVYSPRSFFSTGNAGVTLLSCYYNSILYIIIFDSRVPLNGGKKRKQ